MKIWIIVLVLVFAAAGRVSAAASVVINEFQTQTPQTIEIYNNGTETIDLSGWFIDDNGGTSHFTIPDETILLPNECISFSSSFGFNTSRADSARLFDESAPPTATNAHLIDSFSYDKISDTSKNHQRIPDGSSIWVAAAPSINQLNLNGEPCTAPPTPTPSPTPTRTPSPTKTPTPMPTPVESYSTPATYENIYITEAVPNPQTGQNEWVELYNANDFPVTLESWFIDDVLDAGANPYKFILTIAAKSHGVVDLPSALFNNDGDNIRLLDRNGMQKDTITYQSVREGYSVNRNTILSTAICFAWISRATANNACLVPITAAGVPAADTESSDNPSPSPTELASKKSENNTLGAARGSHPSPSSGASFSPTRDSNTPEPFNYDTEVAGAQELNPFINGLFITSISSALLTIASVIVKMKSW